MYFDNILEEIRENKSKIFLFILLFVVFAVVILFLNNVIDNYTDKKQLEKALVSLGEKVYQDGYYANLKKSPEEYSNDGIKITLNDMFKLVNLNSGEYFYNRKTKEACNINNSYVTIYPQAPYGVNDYEIDFILECGY